MRRKILVHTALLIASFVLSISAFALDFKIGDLTYTTLSSNEVSVKTASTSISEVTIPEKVTYDDVDFYVTAIGQYAFYYCDLLNSITIPQSITSIGSSAFRNCRGLKAVHISDIGAWCNINFEEYYYSNPLAYAHELYLNDQLITELVIPDGVAKINNYTFYNCTSIISIFIPNSVTSIGYCAFYGCRNLTSVTIPNSVTSINDSVFCNCTRMTEVFIPNSITSIGYHAFEACINLTKITIPESVTSIGNSAFCNCYKLTEITIPKTVTSIGTHAFSSCPKILTITLESEILYSNFDEIFDTNRNTALFHVVPNLLSLYKKDYPDFSFISIDGGLNLDITLDNPGDLDKHLKSQSLESVTSLKITGNMNGSDFLALYKMPYIYDLDLSEAKIVEGGMPYYVSDKEYYTINNEMGYKILKPMRQIRNIKLPKSMTFMDKTALETYNSNKILSVDLGDSLQKIPSCYFDKYANIRNITIPSNLDEIGEDAFNLCHNLNMVHISDLTAWCNIKFDNMSSNPLYYAQNLYLNDTLVTDLVIPEGVKSINDFAFNRCSCLTEVKIPNSITTIGEYAFRECYNITSVNIPNLITHIGTSAFGRCEKLTSVSIPKSLSVIGEYAFSGCIGLKKVNISDIGAWCNINFSNSLSNPLHYAKNLYHNDELITNLIIPKEVTTINDYAFVGCESLIDVKIPENVTSLGTSAFEKCINLSDLYLSKSVINFGNLIFNGCNQIKRVHIANPEPPVIDENIFSDYSATLYVPQGSRSTYTEAPVWSKFTIIEDFNSSRIDDTLNDLDMSAPIEVYNLNGVKVATSVEGLEEGIYIVRQGRISKKIEI